MSKQNRILFIAGEMSPFLEITEFADQLNKLAIYSNTQNFEVRCILPRFGIINERRHRLHEVVRLSGIKIPIAQDNYYLQIKVASIPTVRLQVYFLDNDVFYHRKQLFTDEEGKWYADNGLRMLFYCKSALETLKKFGWPPNIIHCSSWMTGLIPYLVRTTYRNDAVFSKCKTVYTVGQNTYTQKLSRNFEKMVNYQNQFNAEELAIFDDGRNAGMFMGGAEYADAITIGSDNIDKSVASYLENVRHKKILPYRSDGDLEGYIQLFNDLTNS